MFNLQQTLRKWLGSVEDGKLNDKFTFVDFYKLVSIIKNVSAYHTDKIRYMFGTLLYEILNCNERIIQEAKTVNIYFIYELVTLNKFSL